jgi:hypothetical protein
MKIYQLRASGYRAVIEGSNRLYSRKVFKSKEEAEKYKGDFCYACVHPVDVADMDYLESVNQCIVVELELVE